MSAEWVASARLAELGAACTNAETCVLKSADFLISALEGAQVGTWQMDGRSGLAIWDETTSELFGLGRVPSAVAGLLPIHEEDREDVQRRLDACARHGTPQEAEYRIVRADGEVRWLQGRASRYQDACGNYYLAGIVTDITERKRARETLRETERQLSTIIDNLPGVAYRCGLRAPWPMTYISAAVEGLTGHPASEFINGSLDWESLIHPDDVPGVREKVERAVARGEKFTLRYRIVRRCGEVRWVHERGSAIYADDGSPQFLEGFVGDIHEQTLVEQKLRETDERYRLVSRATQDLIWDWDILADTVTWNDAVAHLGYTEEDLGTSARWWKDRIHPDDLAAANEAIGAALYGPEPQFACAYRLRRSDGTYAPVFDRGYALRDESGRALRIVGAMQDLTERNLVTSALHKSQELNRSILEASTDCIKILTPDGKLEVINRPGLCAMELESFDSIRGNPWAELWPPQMRSAVRSAVSEAAAGLPVRFSGPCPTARGAKRWWDVAVTPMRDDNGEVVRLLAISRDITATRRSAEQLRWASEHDPLTLLPNRRAFEKHLQAATLRAMETQGQIGLLLLDLDHFKHINDTLGHGAGDHLLKTFAKRLSACVRGDDFVARLGGDEFAVILKSVDGEDDLVRAGTSILQRLQAPIRYEGRTLSGSASIGGALFPRDAETANDLLRNADTALYALKGAGRGGTKLFRSDMREQLQQAASQLSVARTMLSRASIVPFFQQKVDLQTGAIVGFEALLRWQHPTRGLQLPATITESFKDYELASRIGEQMQVGAFEEMRGWLNAGIDFGRVSINAAPSEFLRDDYAERLLERMAARAIPAETVEIEVTEHVFLERGAQYVTRALNLLDSAGVRISLDDFGTGSSSLSHLRDFPVDVIKIDQTFVARMGDEPDIGAIVSAVIDLAASLSLEVVAEGIETPAQAALLRRKGCSIGQGYHFGKAVRAEAVPQLLIDSAAASHHRRFAVPRPRIVDRQRLSA